MSMTNDRGKSRPLADQTIELAGGNRSYGVERICGLELSVPDDDSARAAQAIACAVPVRGNKCSIYHGAYLGQVPSFRRAISGGGIFHGRSSCS